MGVCVSQNMVVFNKDMKRYINKDDYARCTPP